MEPISRFQEAAGTPAIPDERVRRAVTEYLRCVEQVQQLLVLKTDPGQAQPLAFALDHAAWPEIVGTVAGDDTILVVVRSERSAKTLGRRVGSGGRPDRSLRRRTAPTPAEAPTPWRVGRAAIGAAADAFPGWELAPPAPTPGGLVGRQSEPQPTIAGARATGEGRHPPRRREPEGKGGKGVDGTRDTRLLGPVSIRRWRIPWLAEKYDAEVVAVTLDLGQGKGARRRSASGRWRWGRSVATSWMCGPSSWTSTSCPPCQAGALYEGQYPLATALGRPLIAETARRDCGDGVGHRDRPRVYRQGERSGPDSTCRPGR